MKVVVAPFNQEKALVGAFSVIVQLHRLIVYTALVRTATFNEFEVKLVTKRLTVAAKSVPGPSAA